MNNIILPPSQRLSPSIKPSINPSINPSLNLFQWQYFNNSYCTTGEFEGEERSYIKDGSTINTILNEVINNSSYIAVYIYDGPEISPNTCKVRFITNPSTITLLYERYGSMTEFNPNNRYIYNHIPRCIDKGVYQIKQYASIIPSTTSIIPSQRPSTQPSIIPSQIPSTQPSIIPSTQPSIIPSQRPSTQPSIIPSQRPSTQPSIIPSQRPSTPPSIIPSQIPSTQPSIIPSTPPSIIPSQRPSTAPSIRPSIRPSMIPLIIQSQIPSIQSTSKQSTSEQKQQILLTQNDIIVLNIIISFYNSIENIIFKLNNLNQNMIITKSLKIFIMLNTNIKNIIYDNSILYDNNIVYNQISLPLIINNDDNIIINLFKSLSENLTNVNNQIYNKINNFNDNTDVYLKLYKILNILNNNIINIINNYFTIVN